MQDKKDRRPNWLPFHLVAGCFILGLFVITHFVPAKVLRAANSPGPSRIPESFARLVKKASPSVVNISTVKTITAPAGSQLPFGPDDPFRDFFEQFFGGRMPRDFRQQSLGTGLIIDKDGFILTNNHVVEQTDDINVKLEDESEFKAQIIGRDPMTDLALIRIFPDQPLKSLTLGDSDRVQVGDWVVAIGNPFGLGNTVTAGIVSAKYRQIGAGAYDNFIQTDTTINPGNSGGPLLNTAGEVIGINTAIFTQSGANVGIGFAIPINMAKDLLPQLKKGKVIRGWIGVMIQKITPELKEKLDLQDTKGALVSDVTNGGPADRAGIKRKDVIVVFDGKNVRESNELPYLVASTAVGQTVAVGLIRNGSRERVQVTIEELPEEKEPQEITEDNSGLGLTLSEITPELAKSYGLSETSGVLVVEIEPGSPAAEAGLAQGDIILEIDNSMIKNLEKFSREIKNYKHGDIMLLLINREGSTLFLTLKV